MERYELCTELQKKILDRLYVYLGFNEVTSFEKYIEFMFKNAKEGICFDSIFNHTLAHVATKCLAENPQFKKNYIKYFWLKPEDALEHFTTGSDIEYDPVGLFRKYVKEKFNK